MAQVLTKPVFVQAKNNSMSESPVLADTNVLLRMGREIHALSKIGLRITVTRSVLKELRKKDQGLYIYACANFDIINDKTEEIASEAGFIFTHYPDNFLIATAKTKGLPLISYDQVLLKVAVSQGVEACLPEQLVQNKQTFERTQGGM